MSLAIKRLTLSSFRGATQPVTIDFDTTRPLVVMFGENGCGKSCIVDAVDLVANKSFGSLAHRKGIGQKHPFLAPIGQASDAVKIVLETSTGDTWTAVVDGKQVRVTGQGALPTVRVLRRAEILSLVETEPAERYKPLARFIDVSEYEDSETKLRDAYKAALSALNEAAVRAGQASAALDEYWKAEGSPSSSAREWASGKSHVAPEELALSKIRLERIVSAIRELNAARAALAQALKKQQGADHELADAEGAVAGAPQVEGADAVALVGLLQKARAVIGDGSAIAQCPLCRQPKDGRELRASIDTRLISMTGHTKLAGRRDAAHAAQSAATSALVEARGAIPPRLAAVAKVARQAVEHLSPPALALLPGLEAAVLAGDTSGAMRAGHALARVVGNLAGQLASVNADIAKQKGISAQYSTLLKTEADAKTRENLSNRLADMLAVVEDARKAYVDEVLASIGDECRHLYARIHPDEGLGSPNLCMAGEQRRSVDLTAEFEGEKGVPPQGYFSESHLDTLGFCVWLALARREDLKGTVLVLDDIFTSVDAQHLSRLIPLISDVAREFAQVIVTTHYRNWRDRYRLGQAPGMQAQLLELHRWTLERGVSLSSTKLAVEELETKLAAQPLDRQAVASQAGILLEAVLDYLALLYRRRLPRSNDGEWTLGELLDASRKLVKVLTIERDVSGSPTATGPDGKQAKAAVQAVGDVVAPFYQEAGQLSFIRNEVGCHFNVAGAEVSDIDVHAFGTATAAFVRGLECGHCGEIPSRRKGDHFACGCGKTKMKPLECTG